MFVIYQLGYSGVFIHRKWKEHFSVVPHTIVRPISETPILLPNENVTLHNGNEKEPTPCSLLSLYVQPPLCIYTQPNPNTKATKQRMEKHITRNLKLNQSLDEMYILNVFIINNRNQKHNPNTQ